MCPRMAGSSPLWAFRGVAVLLLLLAASATPSSIDTPEMALSKIFSYISSYEAWVATRLISSSCKALKSLGNN
jgi:hypothetical protein